MSKCTPGPFEAGPVSAVRGKISVDLTHHGVSVAVLTGRGDQPSALRANAQLFAEAGTVAHETGLSPRQLAQQREELLDIARRLSELCPSNEGLGGRAPISAFLSLGQRARAAIANVRPTCVECGCLLGSIGDTITRCKTHATK